MPPKKKKLKHSNKFKKTKDSKQILRINIVLVLWSLFFRPFIARKRAGKRLVVIQT